MTEIMNITLERTIAKRKEEISAIRRRRDHSAKKLNRRNVLGDCYKQKEEPIFGDISLSNISAVNSVDDQLSFISDDREYHTPSTECYKGTHEVYEGEMHLLENSMMINGLNGDRHSDIGKAVIQRWNPGILMSPLVCKDLFESFEKSEVLDSKENVPLVPDVIQQGAQDMLQEIAITAENRVLDHINYKLSDNGGCSTKNVETNDSNITEEERQTLTKLCDDMLTQKEQIKEQNKKIEQIMDTFVESKGPNNDPIQESKMKYHWIGLPLVVVILSLLSYDQEQIY